MATDEETARAVNQAIGPVIEEILAPMRDAWHDVEDAIDELEDDAALGRRTREIVRTYATRVLDRQLARDGLVRA
jgi:hypothetical protein